MLKPIYKNSDFIILDKPAGVLTTPAREGDKDPRAVLGLELQKQLGLQIYPVHRLDFEVSGLVVYALNASAHSVANSWFEKKLIQKTYRALTLNCDFQHIPANIENPRQLLSPEFQKTYQWHNKILKGKKRAFVSEHGKASHTLAKCLGFADIEDGISQVLLNEIVDGELLIGTPSILAWDLNPVTGRSHQLRFELSYRGFPILGDRLYGSNVKTSEESRIALRAWKLDLSEIPEKERRGLPKIITLDMNVEW